MPVIFGKISLEANPAFLSLSLQPLWRNFFSLAGLNYNDLPGHEASRWKIKAVFEIRAVSILGFMPSILACHSCDEKNGDFFFDIMGGIIECRSCHERRERSRIEHADPHETHILCILSEGAKIALGYAIYSPIERVFSFNISDEDMRLFGRATEEYILNQLGHSYRSLDFYKSLLR